MKYTPMERRAKLLKLAESDPDCVQTQAESDEALRRFERFVNWLPKPLRLRLWAYPTTAHVAHHRLLDLIFETMRFPEED